MLTDKHRWPYQEIHHGLRETAAEQIPHTAVSLKLDLGSGWQVQGKIAKIAEIAKIG